MVELNEKAVEALVERGVEVLRRLPTAKLSLSDASFIAGWVTDARAVLRQIAALSAPSELNPQALLAAFEAHHAHKADPGRKGCGIEKAIRAYLSAIPAPDDGLVRPVAQHVAYFDDGEFHWMSGIAPRNCELYAVHKADNTLQSKDEQIERLREALNLIDALDPEGQIYGVSPDACRGLIARMGNIARAVLGGQSNG